jgi:hypothetical protein
LRYIENVENSTSFKLTRPIQFVLKSINEYQTEYRKFTSNMKTSSGVAYYLFIYCRELCNFISKYVPERELFKFQLREYPRWFKEQGIVTFWLETYKIVSKEFVANALKLEDVKTISSDVSSDSGISITSVIVAEHLLTVSFRTIPTKIISKFLFKPRQHGTVTR